MPHQFGSSFCGGLFPVSLHVPANELRPFSGKHFHFFHLSFNRLFTILLGIESVKKALLGVAGNHMLIMVIHVTASDDDDEEEDDDDDDEDDDD